MRTSGILRAWSVVPGLAAFLFVAGGTTSAGARDSAVDKAATGDAGFYGAVAGRDLGVYKVSAAARDALVAMHATVYHGRTDGMLVARLTPAQAAELERQGFRVERIYASLEEESRAIRQQPAFDQFHTYDQMRAGFVDEATAHPQIARFVVLGQSVENRDLFALRLSDNPDQEEDEPELAFWGGIHGNENGGAEVSYLYALYLCDNYGTDPVVTEYLDENEVWCIPIINPDGKVHQVRGNGNGIDLNRDLGYEWWGEGGSPAPFSQVETRAVREFRLAHNITLSTTFHTSGDVVLYPWGCAPQDVPDFDITLSLAQGYAAAAGYEFRSSWDDYETHGELLDYVYGSHGAICMTLEVSNLASQIPQTFARNQAGMNLFMRRAGEGLHGVVRDAGTGQPLVAAVWIDGNPICGYSDPLDGGFHRVVAPGTYDLTVWASGYVPRHVPDVLVAEGAPGEFEAQLESGAGDYAFRVVSVNQRNHAYANTTFPSAALGAPDGTACSLGSSGFIVLDMGEGHEIIDRPGADFRVVEALGLSDPFPESYSVYAGSAYLPDVLIGSGTGTAEFDLAASGLSSVRYLKILDQSGAPPDGAYAGMDLDAVIGNFDVSSVPLADGMPLGGFRSRAGDLHLVATPNPFRSDTRLRFTLSRSAPVELTIFDAGGRRLAAPLRLATLPEGEHELRVDGAGWEAGTYFCRIRTEGTSATKMVVRVR